MSKSKSLGKGQVEPCRICGSIEFNPKCPECVEVHEQCILLGTVEEEEVPSSTVTGLAQLSGALCEEPYY